MHPHTQTPKSLVKYMARRLLYLQECISELEENVSVENQKLLTQLDEIPNKTPEDSLTVNQEIHQREKRVANTFRYAMLIAICSFLEESVKQIAQLKFDDYPNELPKKGSTVVRHIRYLKNRIPMSLSVPSTLLDTINSIITLRNCIVHAWGCVDAASDPSKVETAVNHIVSDSKDAIVITKDRFLFLGLCALELAIDASERIVEPLTQACFGILFSDVYYLDTE